MSEHAASTEQNSNQEPDFYEAMNRFVETQPDTSQKGFRGAIWRSFVWNDEEYNLDIRAAQFFPEKYPAQFYFPSKREKLVEKALMVLAANSQPNFDAKSKILVFGLDEITAVVNDLQDEQTFDESEIEFALEVLVLACYILIKSDWEFTFSSLGYLQTTADEDDRTIYAACLSQLLLSRAENIDINFDSEKGEISESIYRRFPRLLSGGM